MIRVGKVALLAALLAATGGACDQRDTPSTGSGLSFYFFAGGDGAADGSLSSVDLSRATVVIEDGDIEAYVWSEQKILLSEAAGASLRDEIAGHFAAQFMMVFHEEPLVVGLAADALIATRFEEHQLRYEWDEFWLSTGKWPQEDVLTEFGLSNSTIDAIRDHFEVTDRLELDGD